jgi:hypothetical protein
VSTNSLIAAKVSVVESAGIPSSSR